MVWVLGVALLLFGTTLGILVAEVSGRDWAGWLVSAGSLVLGGAIGISEIRRPS